MEPGKSFVKSLWQDLKSISFHLWTKEKRLDFQDGFLTSQAFCELLERVRKNLKYELRTYYFEFLRKRKKASSDDYERIVIEFKKGFENRKNKVIEETLKNFNVSQEVFVESREKWLNNSEIIKKLKRLQELVIRSQVIPAGIDQLHTVLITQEYMSLMQESLKSGNHLSQRFKILDSLQEKFGINELDLYLAFKLHRDHPAILQMQELVFELESEFKE
jgi:hypothetical protein